jgi:hypothetical protein
MHGMRLHAAEVQMLGGALLLLRKGRRQQALSQTRVSRMNTQERTYRLGDPEDDLFSDAMDRAVSMYHSVRHGVMRNADRAGESMDGERLVRRALAAGFKAYLEEIGTAEPKCTCWERECICADESSAERFNENQAAKAGVGYDKRCAPPASRDEHRAEPPK